MEPYGSLWNARGTIVILKSPFAHVKKKKASGNSVSGLAEPAGTSWLNLDTLAGPTRAHWLDLAGLG